jgi:hypothetical protein
LRVSDGTREIGEVENERNADFLGMVISVICPANRANKASSSKSFYALILSIVPFCLQALEKYRFAVACVKDFLPKWVADISF